VSTSFLAAVERGTRHGMRVTVFRALLAALGLEDPRVLLADPHGTELERVTAHPCEPVAQHELPSQSKIPAA
jgi:hypothetical protein